MNPADISILIVDDDPELLESITSLFSIFGFNVDDANGGVPAWEKLQKNKYDIVITDVKMPDMNGLELLKNIRAADPFYPKVLLISGYTEYAVEDMYELGANGFFSKPFNATAVRDSLTQTLLSNKELWSQPIKRFGAKALTKKISSLSGAAQEHEFRIGQNGFYVHLEKDLPGVGDPVNFEIEIQDGNPLRELKGAGHVVWVRYQPEGEFLPGVGVKIDYLDEFSITKFIEWIENYKPKSTIPKN